MEHQARYRSAAITQTERTARIGIVGMVVAALKGCSCRLVMDLESLRLVPISTRH